MYPLKLYITVLKIDGIQSSLKIYHLERLAFNILTVLQRAGRQGCDFQNYQEESPTTALLYRTLLVYIVIVIIIIIIIIT
jgi:hypothetical protein